METSEGDRASPASDGRGRPQSMSDLEWLVALEEIRMLKAKRDRYVDANDWKALEALHAPDHVSHTPFGPPWTSPAEMIKNTKARMEGRTIMHASYDPEIVFDTPSRARAIWSMIDSSVDGRSAEGGDASWKILFGYYHETYEKCDGRWLFTSRRWHQYFGITSDGPILADEKPAGSDGFSQALR